MHQAGVGVPGSRGRIGPGDVVNREREREGEGRRFPRRTSSGNYFDG